MVMGVVIPVNGADMHLVNFAQKVYLMNKMYTKSVYKFNNIYMFIHHKGSS